MRRMKVNRGDIVRLVFWDHVANGEGLFSIELSGKVIEIDETFIKIGTWIYDAERHGDFGIDDHNEDWFHIAKSTIHNIEVLKKAK